MKHAAFVVAVILSWLGITTMARAALLPHHDLASLALQAKNVVRVKRASDDTMVVVANYKGDLAPGATIKVSTEGYSLFLATAKPCASANVESGRLFPDSAGARALGFVR